jgi:oligopeptide transport system substrate-binding protein
MPLAKTLLALLLLPIIAAGCGTTSADSPFFGKTDPPKENVFRYVSGGEPESLDPHIGSGQPEARIYMAMFEGLVEYDPKTNAPIPELAERWDISPDLTQFTFYLRKTARWSNGDPITANDFVYSLRRGLSPALAARYAYIAYYINYAQGYNEGGMFVRDRSSGNFDVDPNTHLKIVVPGNSQAKPGKELVPIKGEDIGVQALDDYTLRMTLNQPAPFFLAMIPHQFFRLVPRKAIEKYGDALWTQPENIVTCGPFKLKEWVPYDKIVVVKDPMYWDVQNVKLDEIRFYAIEELTTEMNLYKAGDIDATPNHSVPVAWLDVISPLKDFMNAPEISDDYYQINTTRPPMNDIRVRQAFNLAIDKEALARFRKSQVSLTFVPQHILPGYPNVKGDPFDLERAKRLLAEAGFKDGSGNYDPDKFPIADVELSYNTAESNRQVAEFIQAQWKQNLGLTVPLKNMEFKTFLTSRAALEYKGVARSGWIGDYMDPVTFLNIFYTPKGDNGTGWWDAKFVAMIDDANRTFDPQARYEKLAKAERYMLDAQPIIPLLNGTTRWMKKPYVKGMYPNPQTLHAWKFVYIERDPSKWDYGMPDMTN